MTISSDSRVAGPFSGDGSSTNFVFEFKVFTTADVKVVQTDADAVPTRLALGGDYTVTLNSDQNVAPGGTVTLLAALPVGETLEITSDIAKTQELSLPTGGSFNARAIEDAFDKLTILQQQDDVAASAQAIRVPEVAGVSALPNAADRAGRILAFDPNGDPLMIVGVDSGSAAALALQLANTASVDNGDALIGVGAVSILSSGVRTRYASINAAISAAGSAVCTLTIHGATALTGNASVPSTMSVWVQDSAVIALAGYTLTIAGAFVDLGQAKCFSGSGSVLFSVGSTTYVRPEWWGAKADAATNGASGTDSTTALQAALNVPTVPVLLGYGNYLFSNLTMPAEKGLLGMGIHASNLICKVGSTGTMFTDQGSAAKITIKGVAFYGNNCAYTQGLYLGHGATAFGTEGDLEVWVRDLPSGFAGIDVAGNVGHASRILSQDTGGVNLTGAAWMVDKIQAYGSKGFTVSATSVGCNLQLAGVGSLEVEAPASGIVPLYLSGNAAIGYLYVAPIAATTYPHLVEIGASCSSWNLTLNLGFAAGAAPTITNGNFKSGTRYFGGNATGKSSTGEGFYSSEYFGQREHCFTLRITNSAGTIKHRISTTAGVASQSASAISGASATLQNTPTGADAATAMAFGGKIGSASPSVFWFDTRDQSDAYLQMNCGQVYTDNGTAYTAIPVVQSITINGVARVLFGVQFVNAATGAAFDLTTIAAGKVVQVVCDGYMAV